MNDIRQWAGNPKRLEEALNNHSLKAKHDRNEEMAEKLHKLKLFFLQPSVIIIATLIIVILICGVFYVYFWKKDPTWIIVIHNLLNWGIPSFFASVITKSFTNKQ